MSKIYEFSRVRCALHDSVRGYENLLDFEHCEQVLKRFFFFLFFYFGKCIVPETYFWEDNLGNDVSLGYFEIGR